LGGILLSGFLDKLKLEDVDGETWLVDEPLRFYSSKFGRTFKVPQGTLTDLASIPTWVQVIGAILGLCTPLPRNFLSKSGKYNRAAVLHDAAYRDRLTDLHGIELRVSRKLADELFLEAMLADGICVRKAKALYRAVRTFGKRYHGRK
jgi:hypothetical protein